MRILLDTHCWLWLLARPERLADPALALVQDGSNDVFVSAACVWELAIKSALGKLVLPEPLSTFVPRRLTDQGLIGLPVTLEHAARVELLPHHHRDPFDRLLVAQAQVEELALLTVDPELAAYEVEILWGGRGTPPR